MKNAICLFVVNLPACVIAAVAGMAVAHGATGTSIALAVIAMLCSVSPGRDSTGQEKK